MPNLSPRPWSEKKSASHLLPDIRFIKGPPFLPVFVKTSLSMTMEVEKIDVRFHKSLSMEWNHPYFASPSPVADGQTRWPWLGPGRSLVWAPRAPYREHVGPNRSRKLCGAFESCLENPVIFCVIEAGNFHSVEELYKKKKDIGSFQRKNAFSISQKESGGVTFWGKEMLRVFGSGSFAYTTI